MSKLLTVAIPTYNRIEYLNKNIDALLSQLTIECRLLIIDNHSDYNVLDCLSEKLNKYNNIQIEVVRNNANIGLFGNIVRCFELCETKWIYIMGDDDKLLENGIAKILFDISTYPDYFNISYKWMPENKWSSERPKITTGASNYFKSIESIHHIMFLSSNVYNAEKLNDFVYQGNYYQLTNAPHLAMLFIALNNNPEGNVFLSDNYIVNNLNSEVDQEKRWNKFDFFRNIKLLVDLPLNKGNKKSLFLLYKKSYPLKKYLRFYINYSRNNSSAVIKEFRIATIYYIFQGNNLYQILIPFYSLVLFTPKTIKYIWRMMNKLKHSINL